VRLLTRVLGKAVADVRDTCLAHWSPGFAPGLEGFLLHPVPFHPGWAGTRGDAAKLFSPPKGRLAGLSADVRALARALLQEAARPVLRSELEESGASKQKEFYRNFASFSRRFWPRISYLSGYLSVDYKAS